MALVLDGTSGVSGNSGAIVSGTAVSASGTSVDFTGIPSWVKRVTVMFNRVSTSGTSIPLVQLGDSGGVENTGYESGGWTNNTNAASSTIGMLVGGVHTAAQSISGNFVLTKVDGNSWVGSSVLVAAANNAYIGGGSKTLSETLTQVRITTVNGTDTFDAGTINIIYE